MIKINNKRSLLFVLIGLSFLNMGVIRRDEDPILKTQTDPISLKQKLEETKDGVKGAPAPSFSYYGKENFLSRSPMNTAEEAVEPPVKAKTDSQLESIQEVSETESIEVAAPELSVEEGQDPEEKAPAQESQEDDWWMEDGAQDKDSK